MINLQKHTNDQELAQILIQSVNKRLPRFIEISKTKNYNTLIKVGNINLELIALSINHLKQKKIKLILEQAKNAFSTYLKLKATPGKEFPVDLDGKGSVMLKADDGDVFSGGQWLNALYLNLILRKKEDFDMLFNLDISKVKPLNEKDHLLIGHLNFKFFHSLGINSKPDYSLFEKMEQLVNKHFIGGLYIPDVDEFPYSNFFFSFNRALILKAIIEENQEEFNKNLVDGIMHHKAYWGRKHGLNKGDSPLCDDPLGFISWPLTALAAMAFDKGLKIEVESDYTPKWMVEGKWD